MLICVEFPIIYLNFWNKGYTLNVLYSANYPEKSRQIWVFYKMVLKLPITSMFLNPVLDGLLTNQSNEHCTKFWNGEISKSLKQGRKKLSYGKSLLIPRIQNTVKIITQKISLPR